MYSVVMAILIVKPNSARMVRIAVQACKQSMASWQVGKLIKVWDVCVHDICVYVQ